MKTLLFLSLAIFLSSCGESLEIKTCKEAGGVWEEDYNECFEDPSKMADPKMPN